MNAEDLLLRPALLEKLEALARAWSDVSAEIAMPTDYSGIATVAAYDASELLQALIRDRIVTQNDLRLFSLLHLTGQASLGMEHVLWPEEYARMTEAIKEAVRLADLPGAKTYSTEEVFESLRQAGYRGSADSSA